MWLQNAGYNMMYMYLYRRANGMYIPKICNLQRIDSLTLYLVDLACNDPEFIGVK